MQLRPLFIWTELFLAGAAIAAAQTTATPVASDTVIRTETRVVLLDAVVTDKKGGYVRGLTKKDFKVWEDGKQQEISSFNFEADPDSPTKARPKYMVLFFDNSSMDFGQQRQARDAAAKFIASNAGPNRLMAIANFTGTLRIDQNFTDDADRLQKIVSGTKLSMTSANSSTGGPNLSRAERQFGITSGILALRSLAKNLADVPGRKSLILLTGGFRLTPEGMTELQALIDVCNKSNVAVYPIDVRGLIATPMGDSGQRSPFQLASFGRSLAGSGFGFAQPSFGTSFFQGTRAGAPTAPSAPSAPSAPAGGGGAGGGSGRTSAGSGGFGAGASNGNTGNNGGGRTSTGMPSTGNGGRATGGFPGGNGNTRNNGGGDPTNPNLNSNRDPNRQGRGAITPRFPDSASTNQQPLYMLADGTGGFVIVNTNDLLGGLEKIGKEQNEFYMLGYTPPESSDGSCHVLKVKVDKSGTTVRARTGYCNVKQQDVLAGNPTEKNMETLLKSSAPGIQGAAMMAPFFYTSPDTARTTVAMEIPSEAINFEKVKGKFVGVLNVLGVAYAEDGTVAARFSDSIKINFENKKLVETFQEEPLLHYEKDFEIAVGKFTLKVVYSSGKTFGRLELPLNIDKFEKSKFRMSGLAFSKSFHKMTPQDSNIDSALVEDRTPLIANGVKFTPTGLNSFRKTDNVALYAQLYDDMLTAEDTPKGFVVGIQLRIIDGKTKTMKLDSGAMATKINPGNALIPVGLKLLVDKLEPGEYFAELTAQDSANNSVRRYEKFIVR